MCCFNNIFENCNFWIILIALLIIISMCNNGDYSTYNNRSGCGCD